MYLVDAYQRPIELDLLGEAPSASGRGQVGEWLTTLATATENPPGSSRVPVGRVGVRAIRVLDAAVRARRGRTPPPTAFRERASGLLRIADREVVVRFARDAAGAAARISAENGLERRRGNPFVPEQVVFGDPVRSGPELVELCNRLAEYDEVIFATPSFVSEYRREIPAPPVDQWHLENRAARTGQRAGEDVGAVTAWQATTGDERVVVAVVDDGVDVEHPNLADRIWNNPDPAAPDRYGRDYFAADSEAGFSDPRPKQWRFPFDDTSVNDIHGTPCAGLIAAAGRGAYGVAFSCRVLSVKVFHAGRLAADERVADAIRYAATKADIVSCSWSGPRGPDTQLALEDAGRLGRGGRGSALFCSSGNRNAAVSFPASSNYAIAVGASTDQGERASYSNFGPELDLVAPSNGGVAGIFTTDVSLAGRGYNPGDDGRGGADGLHTNAFGGTSAACPLAAGVGALVLAVAPQLDRDELRELLKATTDQIGNDAYAPGGRNDHYGHGRVNAAKAVIEAVARGEAEHGG